jgi:hypothetical protein
MGLINEQEWKNKQYELEKEQLKQEKDLKERELGIKAKEVGAKTAGLMNDPYQKMPAMDKVLAEEEVKTYAKRQGAVDKLSSAMKQLEDPKMPEDQKVTVGQGILKLLNDPEVSDAVGVDEVKRIGAYLERFSLSRAGSMFGRDLPRFTSQVQNKLDLVKNMQSQSKERLQQKGLLQTVDQGPVQDPQIAKYAQEYGMTYGQAQALINERKSKAVKNTTSGASGGF